MFNLETVIATWRKQTAAAGIRTPDHLDELESHLREEIAVQLKAGLNESQAFAAALQKIGPARVLRTEFKKAGGRNSPGYRRLPLLVTASICVPLLGLILWLGAVTFSRIGMSLGQQTLGLAALVFTLLVAFQWRRAVKFLPFIPNPWVRVAAGFAMIGLGIGMFSFFTNYILPHQTSDDLADLLAPLFWGFLPLAAMICLGVGFMMDQHERAIFATGGVSQARF